MTGRLALATRPRTNALPTDHVNKVELVDLIDLANLAFSDRLHNRLAEVGVCAQQASSLARGGR